MSRATRFVLGTTMVLVTAFLAAGYAQQAARPSTDVYRQLHWRFIGLVGEVCENSISCSHRLGVKSRL